MALSPARRAAYRILKRVETGGYSSELLHTSPELAEMDLRDRALATELVLGSLRWQGALDDLLRQAAGRPVEKLDPEVRIALRIGAYQLRYLERIPDRAAVSESVELVKRARKRSAMGLVNAVLRRLPERESPEHDGGRERELAHPTWLVERWQRNYGDDAANRILRFNQTPPPTYLRLNVSFPVGETLERLAREGIETAPTELAACRRVLSGRPAATECFREGRVRIQDLGSQAIVPLLDLAPGRRFPGLGFLDLCAAPGGKTYQALESAGGDLRAVAADRHLHRLSTMRRLETCPVPLVVVDAEAELPFRSSFDRVLVDAPCSGTGTLARNPEIKWRLTEDDLADLARKQRRILSRGLDTLAKDGILVYSTCSLEPEENRQVVEAVLSERTAFVASEYLDRLPGREEGDGFFACRITREATARRW